MSTGGGEVVGLTEPSLAFRLPSSDPVQGWRCLGVGFNLAPLHAHRAVHMPISYEN